MYTDCLQKVPPRMVVNIQDVVTAVIYVEKINRKKIYNFHCNSSFPYKVPVCGLFLYLKSSRIYFGSKIMGTFFTNLFY